MFPQIIIRGGLFKTIIILTMRVQNRLAAPPRRSLEFFSQCLTPAPNCILHSKLLFYLPWLKKHRAIINWLSLDYQERNRDLVVDEICAQINQISDRREAVKYTLNKICLLKTAIRSRYFDSSPLIPLRIVLHTALIWCWRFTNLPRWHCQHRRSAVCFSYF